MSTLLEGDKPRLKRQLDAIRDIMLPGGWWTLAGLVRVLRSVHGIIATEAGVSARIRELRALKHGRHQVQRKLIDGLYAYHLGPPGSEPWPEPMPPRRALLARVAELERENARLKEVARG